MRTIGSCLLLLFLSVMTAFPSFSQDVVQPAVPAAEIHFDMKKIDLGDTLYRKDSTYVYRFTYENTGTEPLIVNKVVGHCPCVTITHSTEPLPPGGRDTVSVYFKPTHASKYTQRIAVFNNSSRSVVTLYAKGNFLTLSDWKSKTKPEPDE